MVVKLLIQHWYCAWLVSLLKKFNTFAVKSMYVGTLQKKNLHFLHESSCILLEVYFRSSASKEIYGS